MGRAGHWSQQGRTRGEQSTEYRVVESLWSTSKTNVSLCVSYTGRKEGQEGGKEGRKKKEGQREGGRREGGNKEGGNGQARRDLSTGSTFFSEGSFIAAFKDLQLTESVPDNPLLKVE